MNRVTQILMKRDGLSKAEAESMIQECVEAIVEADPFEADEIIEDYLGLEPDYLPDLIGFF